MSAFRRLLLGESLPSTRAVHERLRKTLALPIFASDAVSSTAYATEEILLALVVAGAVALQWATPVGLAIALLFVIVSVSYRQTVFAYPSGGGAYVVARENLGLTAGLTAAAALLTDYVLTVAVSVSSGVAAIISAFPALAPERIPLCVGLIGILSLANLRGVRESGKLFAGPTYLFIATALLLIGTGLVRLIQGNWQPLPGPSPAEMSVLEPLTIFLVLRAFASGCAALTGIEAISNGVRAFRSPESRNAAVTLMWMAVICVVLFVGITVLTQQFHIIPDLHAHETVLSKLGKIVFGVGPLYYVLQAATAMILILAANTSFAGFPQLASILGRDGFAPHQLANLGDRLVFGNGILLLGGCSMVLVAAFGGVTHNLIPLYAVGVFISFTLSQAGMVLHWRREATRGWQVKAAVNAVGAVATGVVLVVVGSVKFMHGAWIVLAVIPVAILAFRKVYAHYQQLAQELTLEGRPVPAGLSHVAVVLLSDATGDPSLAVQYAQSIADRPEAVLLETRPERIAAWRERWARLVTEVPLQVLDGTSVQDTLIPHLRRLRVERGVELATVLVPAPEKPGGLGAAWARLRLQAALLGEPGVVVTDVHFQLPPGRQPKQLRHPVFVLVPGLNRGILRALLYARLLSPDAHAISVEIDPAETALLQEEWAQLPFSMPLTVLKSPWRSLTEPVLRFLDTVRQEEGTHAITVVIPEFATTRWWHTLLHNQSGFTMRRALWSVPDVVVTNVRYQAEE
jgi:amino acid transporter